MGQLKRSRFNWEAVQADLEEMRKEGKSLREINEYLDFKFGKKFTIARLSQIFKMFREQEQLNAN